MEQNSTGLRYRRLRFSLRAMWAAVLTSMVLASLFLIWHWATRPPSLWESFKEANHLSDNEPRFRLLPGKIREITAAQLSRIVQNNSAGFRLRILNISVAWPSQPNSISASAASQAGGRPVGAWQLEWGHGAAVGGKVSFPIAATPRLEGRYRVLTPLDTNINFWFLGPGADIGTHVPRAGTTWLALGIRHNPPDFRPRVTDVTASGGNVNPWNADSCFGMTSHWQPVGAALMLWRYQLNHQGTEKRFTATLSRAAWGCRRTARALIQVEREAKLLSPEAFINLQLTGAAPRRLKLSAVRQRLLQLFALSAFYGHYVFPPRCLRVIRVAIGGGALYVLHLQTASFVRGALEDWMDYFYFGNGGVLTACGRFNPVRAHATSSQLASLALGMSGISGPATTK